MRFLLPIAVALLFITQAALGYVEAPMSLGQCVRDSSHIVLVEVLRVNTEKNLIIYKKLEDIKGIHKETEIKHNIGKRGFHPREWQNVIQWAQEGKKAVFFHNGQASETCIGTYWYQCYREGEWWGMSHAEPFLLRTFYGDPEKLVAAVKAMLKGEEAIVTCLADGNKNELHQRKGKLQMMRASLKRLDYNPKRDFVGFGGDPGDIVQYKRTVLLAESAPGWKFLPLAQARDAGERWREPDFDDRAWRTGKAPIGYGEEEIKKRGGTWVKEEGQPFLFRKDVFISEEDLRLKDATFNLGVASDDFAVVYINGQLADKDPGPDHEFAYWNRDVEVPLKLLKPGRNVIAAFVMNNPKSSDIYLDMELSVQVPLPRKKIVASNPTEKPKTNPIPLPELDKIPASVVIDKAKRTITLPCLIAPRQLPQFKVVYPIEVVATYPTPKGQKAHETMVVFADFKPSHVHRAMEEIGLKPGRPALGEDARAEGPEVNIFLELPDAESKTKRLPIEKALMDTRTGKPLPPFTWRFTGSTLKQPDPEKDDKVYGADLTGTLISIFPVTADTVFQTSLTLKDESQLRLEIARDILPREGTPVKLIIEAK